jgi:hypothetical protein
MANPESLIPFQVGEDDRRNKNGRPVGVKNRSTVAREVLSRVVNLDKATFNKLKKIYPDIEPQMTVEQIMTFVQTGKSISRADTYAYNSVMDSAYGKPAQDLDIKANIHLSDKPIVFE